MKGKKSVASLNMADMTSRTTSDKPKRKKWVQKADIKKGAFTKKADAAGKSVQEYASEKADAPGTLGKEARLAKTFEGFARKKKSPLHDHPNSK